MFNIRQHARNLQSRHLYDTCSGRGGAEGVRMTKKETETEREREREREKWRDKTLR